MPRVNAIDPPKIAYLLESNIFNFCATFSFNLKSLRKLWPHLTHSSISCCSTRAQRKTRSYLNQTSVSKALIQIGTNADSTHEINIFSITSYRNKKESVKMYLPKRSRLVLREISGTVHILRIMESVLGDKLLFKNE